MNRFENSWNCPYVIKEKLPGEYTGLMEEGLLAMKKGWGDKIWQTILDLSSASDLSITLIMPQKKIGLNNPGGVKAVMIVGATEDYQLVGVQHMIRGLKLNLNVFGQERKFHFIIPDRAQTASVRTQPDGNCLDKVLFLAGAYQMYDGGIIGSHDKPYLLKEGLLTDYEKGDRLQVIEAILVYMNPSLSKTLYQMEKRPPMTSFLYITHVMKV